MRLRILVKSCVTVQLRFLHLDITEAHTTRGTDWSKTAINDTAEYLLPTANADGKVTHTRRPAPDMRNGGHSEVAAPPESYAHATEQGDELVAKTLATLETCIGSFPDTVDRAHSLWLS